MTDKIAAARFAALHEASDQIEAYLRAQYAPPMWWRVYDILHSLAGCTWDDMAGEDGYGEYDCETSAGRAVAAAIKEVTQ